MKKVLFAVATIAVVGMSAYGVIRQQNSNEPLSELNMKNIVALTQVPDNDPGSTIKECYTWFSAESDELYYGSCSRTAEPNIYYSCNQPKLLKPHPLSQKSYCIQLLGK